MKFSIITPTYKRPELLKRSVQSVLNQTESDWEMIIVNDSPEDPSYASLASSFSDPRIRYFANDVNRGVNYSRNFALENISKDSVWVIFLDDDDYLSPDALETFQKLSVEQPQSNWFVTNRAYADGSLVTRYPKVESFYSYIKDVLLLKRCRGDVTHCIKSNLLKNVRYSKYVKQAEEWIFYYQISLTEKIFYHNHNSTLTDGYDKENGLNFRKRTRREQLQTIDAFITEGKQLHLLHHPTFILYLLLRFVRLVFKS